MHTLLPFILVLVLLIVFLTIWANQLKIAYPILLVLAGLGISFIPGLPVIEIDPDLIFLIFLPPLLFEAAWGVSFKEMKKWWRIIGSFAFLVVFFTAFLVAIISNQIIPGFSIALGFVLGGIVSPPDAVSTGAITKFVKIPKSTSAILEGESLLNDASSLIIFRFALVAVGTGQFIWYEAGLDFLWMLFGGVGLGLLIGQIFIWIHRHLPTEPASDIALTLITPYFMYFIAEQIHCSGVLAVVAGGLYMSNKRLTFLAATSRLKGASVWESFVFLLNGMVFLLIGLDLPVIVDGIRAHGTPLSTAIGYGVIITLVLIAARMISAYAAMFATIIFRPQVAHQQQLSSRRWYTPLLMGWTGMRGVVSLAAALAIPLTLPNGEVFPHRNLILFITFIAILLTLVIQGLTLPYLIEKTNWFRGLENEDEIHNNTKLKMKLGLKSHVYNYVKGRYETQSSADEAMERILKYWEDQTKVQDNSWMNGVSKQILLDIFAEQRIYLTTLNKDEEFDEELIRKQIYQIDLEEERILLVFGKH
ncbi:Na+/H+ antiporter [Sphingobacterium endophyticum]|uniref:Na+/H+ antiporter n=1 Tax=Sphingobacterium endophyticum TaxID=2546448 RepID=UPI0012E293DC|nr:Na+/H+ antiporter [Sphingobacterium endophyticum]